MRRFFSIATVGLLLFSLVSPAMAACTGTGKAASCHAMEAPHADHAMHHHHHSEDEQAAPAGSSGVNIGNTDAKCPMDCCTPGHRQSGTALIAHSIFPPLAVSDQSFNRITVVFVSPGFSSHTDRGPPLA